MRVLLATSMTVPHTGGASTHFELLARALQASNRLAGCVVGQNCRPGALSTIACAARALADIDAFRRELLDATASRLTAAINTLAPNVDLVHCHDALAAYAAANAPIVRDRCLPIIQTVHGPWSREIRTSGVKGTSKYYRAARAIEELAYASCTRFIAVDRGQADILAEDFKVARERISIVHNATDCEEVAILARQTGAETVGQPYFVVPRRLVLKNGVGVAIDALKLLQSYSVRLAIAGDGPLAMELQRRARENGVGDRVHFLGSLPHERLLPLVTKSAGVIVPSVPAEGVIEATSLAVIEAFACEAPVVASNIGGLAELIEHGRTGLLFTPGDPVALASALKYLLHMPVASRRRLCLAAHAAAIANWDVKPWLDRTTGAYYLAISDK